VAEREREHDPEHQVTPLELFFDLTFVFAFTGSLLSTLTSGEARRSAPRQPGTA
jgi:low temperature requirement protein LtrA